VSRIHYKNYRNITLLARKLRKESTPSEKVLWKVLRAKNLNGLRFLRQHPLFYRINGDWVEFFIADFYCARFNLIIELDGPIHQQRVEEDRERDSKLASRGFVIKRFRNEELEDINKVTQSILDFVDILNGNKSTE